MTAVDYEPDLDAERALEVAKLLLGRPEHRDEIERLAYSVLKKNPAGRLATCARQILDKLDATDRKPSEPDPDLRDAWAVLTGLDDGRLKAVWALTTQDPQRFARLRSEVERDLGGWIRMLAHDLRCAVDGGGEDRRRHLETLDFLTATPAFRDHLEMPLREAIEELRVARFELRVVEKEAEIRQTLELWQVERALELLEALGEPPVGVTENPLLEYRQRLEAIEERRGTVEELRTRLAEVKTPTDWGALRRSLDLLVGARNWLAETLPAPVRDGLETAIGRARTGIPHFIEREARSAAGFETVCELGRNLERLAPRLSAAGVVLEPSLFEPMVAVLERVWRKRLRAAKEPADLEALARDLALEGMQLPSPLAEAGRRWVVRVCGISETWRALRRGEPFDALPSGPLPTRFKAEHKTQAKVAAQIADATHLLQTTPAGARRARVIAERILRRFPEHAGATRLAQKAEQAELARDLDRRLGGLDEGAFDLEGYCEVAGWRTAPDAHRALAARREILAEISRLLAEPPLDRPDAGAAWWTCFAEVTRSLPDPTLPALERRLEQESRARRAQWALALDQALAAEAPAAFWAGLAYGLEEVANDPGFDPAGELERYRVELLRRAELARVAEHLHSGRFDRAREILATVEGDPDRKRDLEVRLAIEGSRARGDLLAFAAALDRYWGRASQIYGAKAAENLLAALTDAWKERARNAIVTLRTVARRVLPSTDPESEAGQHLRRWIAWLELEERAVGGMEVLTVAPLLAYLQGLETDARRLRAGSLVEGWRASGSRISLAWVFQALPELRGDLFPDSVDPVEGIADEIETLTSEIDSWFAAPSRADADLATTLGDEAQAFQRRGERLAAEISQLDDLLDELPFSVARFQPHRSFDRALRQVASVLAILNHLAVLESSDLRHEGDRRDRCGVHLGELPPAPWGSLLAQRLQRLEPLTRLTYDENRVKDAARLCGDPDALDTSGAFAALAAALLVITSKLEAAGCSQAPVARVIALEYWRELPKTAGDRTLPRFDHPPTLPDLAAHCESLERNEQRFREAIIELVRREPILGASGRVEPERHRDYLALVPAEAPGSGRALGLFERFLRFGERRELFERGVDAGLLPAWVSGVLRGGSV